MPLIDGSSGDHTKVHDYKRAEISDGSVSEKTVGKFAILSLSQAYIRLQLCLCETKCELDLTYILSLGSEQTVHAGQAACFCAGEGSF